MGEPIVQIGEVVQDLFILSRGLILCKGQIQAATHGANVCFAEASLNTSPTHNPKRTIVVITAIPLTLRNS